MKYKFKDFSFAHTSGLQNLSILDKNFGANGCRLSKYLPSCLTSTTFFFRIFAMESVTIRSYAKINLGLRVLAKRSDGYHNIETIFVPIRLCDKIQLKMIGKDIIIKTVDDKIKIPKGKTNLAYKASSLFLKAVGSHRGVEILIKKNIPVGAGLGGGSSDAAGVLKGLNQLFGNPLTKGDLYNLALKIGMDVPFFLLGKPCYATGRGEILEPITLPELSVVLYYPGYPISTKWAYKNLKVNKFRLTKGNLSLMILKEKLKSGDLRNWSRYIVNSFEDLVFDFYPDLAEMKDFFLKNGAFVASLSGSGSAIYGLVKEKNLGKLKNALQRRHIKTIFTKFV